MSLDVTTLRESFELVVERQPQLTRRFYEILFQRYPQVRPMFGASTQKQEEMLTRALVAILDRIEDGAWLADTLEALGAKHADYGVTEEMYAWVSDALLATLAEIAEGAWTPRVRKAWSDALDAIAQMMIAGARKATNAVPSTLPLSRQSPDASAPSMP